MPYSKYTPKQKRLAAMYGDKKKITRGDIITAAKKKNQWQKQKNQAVLNLQTQRCMHE